MKTSKTLNRVAACATLALTGLLSGNPLRAQDADGFVPLFNGRDLAG